MKKNDKTPTGKQKKKSKVKSRLTRQESASSLTYEATRKLRMVRVQGK